jgi:carboxylesterase type B
MVSINYRLGNLGFLSLGENELPGNMGLRDQTFALEWVQSNIEQFSGDPNKITIMGESAGSWSVFYHMMSPRSTNLFQQVIGQSGTVVSPNWREYTAEEAKR